MMSTTDAERRQNNIAALPNSPCRARKASSDGRPANDAVVLQISPGILALFDDL
jgi:hypothetical protein